MSDDRASLRSQLANTDENLRLIRERKSVYVQNPTSRRNLCIRNRWLKKRIAELYAASGKLDTMEVETTGADADALTFQEFAMREPLPLATIQGAVLECLRDLAGRDYLYAFCNAPVGAFCEKGLYSRKGLPWPDSPFYVQIFHGQIMKHYVCTFLLNHREHGGRREKTLCALCTLW